MSTVMEKEVLWQLNDRGHTFGIVFQNGIVVDGAPCARWLFGKDELEVLEACRLRRITVEVV